jgi:dTDP-4-dehydrorhamnose 3,5-epimerase
MIFRETRLKGAFVIEMERREDHRGSFARTWCAEEFRSHGLNISMVQGNTAHSKVRGTLRGMHMQKAPYGEAKLIRCIRGTIYDVMLDVRPDSATFKEWVSVELDEKSNLMLFVPEGFAHGYQTLRDDTEVFYLVSQFYSPECETGVRYDDPAFRINWPIRDVALISEKDRSWPDFLG